MPAPGLNPHIFRAYDIRGIARGRPDDDLSPAIAERIGRAFSTYLRRLRPGTSLRVLVGRDNRPSSPQLYEAVIAGLRASGADVSGIDLAPSPLTYFAAAEGGFDGAVSVTASHNPVEFNGFKLLREEALPLLSEEIQAVGRLVRDDDFETGNGALEQARPHDAYVRMLGERFQLGRPLRIVADPGNGVATLTGPPALEAAGADVVPLYAELVEGFPNHIANPQDAATMRDLADRVVAEGADCGFAWDGDGDRFGLVDEGGRRYEADWIVALIARDVLRRHPGTRILVDMKSSRSAIEDIRAHGGVPVLARTGYSTFRRQMRAEGILFGGEASGHIMFGEDYPCLDDGVYAACVVAKIVADAGEPLSRLFAGMPVYVTSPEVGLPCADAEKFAVAEAVAAEFRDRYEVSELDGARIEFPDGWAHVRASNTTPALSVRIEAESRERFDAIRSMLWDAISKHSSVTIPEGAAEPEQ
ncbi:MAG: phosphomannomutase/phosphoglucomutase [Chloroflexi bacterium]|nr:phosphomannomutase/phosphoglucomutase [Chloroflexota bacterium]